MKTGFSTHGPFYYEIGKIGKTMLNKTMKHDTLSENRHRLYQSTYERLFIKTRIEVKEWIVKENTEG